MRKVHLHRSQTGDYLCSDPNCTHTELDEKVRRMRTMITTSFAISLGYIVAVTGFDPLAVLATALIGAAFIVDDLQRRRGRH